MLFLNISRLDLRATNQRNDRKKMPEKSSVTETLAVGFDSQRVNTRRRSCEDKVIKPTKRLSKPFNTASDALTAKDGRSTLLG